MPVQLGCRGITLLIILFQLSALTALLIPVQATLAQESLMRSPPDNLDTVKKYADIISPVTEIAIVVLLWKTVKDFAELARGSKLQTEVRFRPWIGPSSNFEYVREYDNKKQYSITLKNFGEIPSARVVARSIFSNSAIARDALDKENVHEFDLGPLLPNMEKRYWIFINSDIIERTIQGSEQTLVAVHFSYTFLGGKSGYGMISQLDKNTQSFVHRDMWID